MIHYFNLAIDFRTQIYIIQNKTAQKHMSKKGKSRSGGKFTGAHTTLTEKATRVADFLSPLDFVTKIAIGVINPVSSRNGNSIKIRDLGNSLEVKIVGGGVQTIYVYGDHKSIINALNEAFKEIVRTQSTD